MAEENISQDEDSPCRVLVVDDDKPMRELLKALLEGFGAVVIAEAENGEEAVRSFDEYLPDLTFLDIQMPIMDGRDALRTIIGKHSTAQLVMLTATSDMTVADECIEIGARGYIRKGAAPSALRLMVKSQLDSFMAG